MRKILQRLLYECQLAGNSVLVLKILREGRRSNFNTEFQYPGVGGIVEAPDWDRRAFCGGGLHGYLWGQGDIEVSCYEECCNHEEIIFQVHRVFKPDMVILNDKVKYKRAKVVFESIYAYEAIDYIEKYSLEDADHTSLFQKQESFDEGSILLSGDITKQTSLHENAIQIAKKLSRQKAISGAIQKTFAKSKQVAKEGSMQRSGSNSEQYAGDDSLQITGSQSVQSSGDNSMQVSNWSSTQITQRDSIQKSSNGSKLFAAKNAIQVAGANSFLSAGPNSIQKAGYGSHCRAGLGSIISIGKVNWQSGDYYTFIIDNINYHSNTWYRLDDNDKPITVSAEQVSTTLPTIDSPYDNEEIS